MTKKIMGPETRWESFEKFLQEEFRAMVDSLVKDQKPKTVREFFESVPKNPFTGNPFLPMTPNVQLTASILDFDIRPKLASIWQPTLILLTAGKLSRNLAIRFNTFTRKMRDSPPHEIRVSMHRRDR